MGPGFTTVFGGNNIAPALPTYLPLSISANTLLGWPTELTAAGQPIVAEILDITATVAALSLQLSDARRVSTGYCALFNNVGANTFSVLDNLGNTLMTVPSGQVWQIYLADNSTQQGTWRVFQFGAGVSSANAGSLAGAGLKAIATTLNENILINQQSVNYAIGNADRASCIEWTGGSGGTFTLPNPATVGSGWFCFVQNSGTGTLAVTPSSGTLNGTASQIFQPYDSAIIATDGVNFVTIGFGRSVASTFNFVQISLAGLGPGTYNLTGANLNRISYRFVGALAGNLIVQLPSSIQQYWVDNETTGAFTLAFNASGANTTVAQGNRAILYCDGTNVINAVTIPTVAAGGANTQVQYNNLGAFSGSTMTYQTATGQFAIAAPTAGAPLTINGLASAGGDCLILNTPTVGADCRQDFQINTALAALIAAVGTAGDLCTGSLAGDFLIRSQASRVIITPNAGTNIGLAIGTAIQGFGPVAAGLVDMTPDRSSFNSNISGITTVLTTPVSWVRQGGQVDITISGFTAISGSALFSLGSFPPAIQPATMNVYMDVPADLVEDNGTRSTTVSAAFTGAGVLSFAINGNVAGWTGAGNKGILQNITLHYPLT